VVYRDVTRQAKGLYRLKHVGALRNGLAYLSRYNSGLFCHTNEKVPKIKVVEFFKIYKNALVLKFKSSKFAALQDRFWIKVKFELPWSLPK
jgi:hypothetical protein